MNWTQIQTTVSGQSDYRLGRDGGIDIVSDRARNRAGGGNPVTVGTRVIFRSKEETEQYIRKAIQDGYTVER